MGMDVYGKAPKSERGEYFRNNIWWWRPLWDYCEEVAPDLCSNVDGHSNSGDGLDDKGAEQLSQILKIRLSDGSVDKYAQEREVYLSALPKEVCDFCDGVGIVQVKEGWPDYVEGQVTFRDPCNACNGTKEKEPWQRHYPFSKENVQEFAEFLADSGGFEIC
jgi:hypothetical protein